VEVEVEVEVTVFFEAAVLQVESSILGRVLHLMLEYQLAYHNQFKSALLDPS
jgi:hypothetical protein